MPRQISELGREAQAIVSEIITKWHLNHQASPGQLQRVIRATPAMKRDAEALNEALSYFGCYCNTQTGNGDFNVVPGTPPTPQSSAPPVKQPSGPRVGNRMAVRQAERFFGIS